MADIRFSCQACHQHITCDAAWAGHQIQCPICSKTVTVPTKVTASISAPHSAGAAPAAPKAPETLVPKVPEATKLAFQKNAQQPATQERNIPIRNLATPVAKKEGPWRTIGIVTAILIIAGAGGYFAWPYVSKMINKEEKPAPQAAAPTEPEKRPEETAAAAQPSPAAAEAPVPGPADQAGAQSGSETSTSAAPAKVEQTGIVIPAVHTLEIASARIPSGRVNGKISGAEFVPDNIRIDPLGASQVLRFTEGELMSPEREILIYLRLKPGEKLQGQKINVSEDLRTRGLPQITKRWRTNPKYAATSRSFSSGYVLKLELGEHSNGTVKGKVYVSLPDNELTVAAGNFTAATTIPTEGIAAPTAVPGTTAQPGAPTPGEQAVPPEYQRRGYPMRR